ncbi:RyR domain-containing protein [Mycolicibacterium sp. XJ1819]
MSTRGRLAGPGRGWLTHVLALLDICYVAALLYLCVVAVNPAVTKRVPEPLRWFGAPIPRGETAWAATATIAVVLAFPIVHVALRRLSGRTAFSGQPLVVIAAMAASALVLGMSAYLPCHDGESPIFAPLAWTLALFLGNVQTFADGACANMPIALEVARLLALATTLTAALAAGLALFRSQLDRVAIWRANSLTVVVGVDDDTVSMVRAILRTQNPAGAVVILTDDIDGEAGRRARALGAKLRAVDLAEDDALSRLTLWNRSERLYLLSGDPVDNIKHFKTIDAAVAQRGSGPVRMPLTVRIDDPWQAEVWRRSFLASTERRWVADAVGKYEVTAAKLVRHMTTRPERGAVARELPNTVVLCGLYPLTYAMASELAQLQREQGMYEKPDVVRPSNVVIFAEGAKSFVEDHEIRQGRMAPDGTMLPVVDHNSNPTVEAIAEYLRDKDPAMHSFVLGDPELETHGTRLASRFPNLRIYLAATAATSLIDVSIVGELFTFPIDMEFETDAPQDVWERAAELIHEHYSAGTARDKPSTKPWKDLDPFIRHSNRRQVLNALWMVETFGDHTWNSLEQSGPTAPLPVTFADLTTTEQLQILGFDGDTVEAMIKAEHEDWRKYYEDAGWKYDDRREDSRRRHDRLLPFDELVARHPEYAEDSRRSLLSTLLNLRNLGYRSVPKWRRYRRRGEITAQRRDHPWEWTTPAGDVMRAQPGDWTVVDEGGNERSVAAAVFEATHEEVGPRRYRRCGTVSARRSTWREVIHTLEGDAVANAGDWIVRGPQGEMWPVADEQFRSSYEGPLDDEEG